MSTIDNLPARARDAYRIDPETGCWVWQKSRHQEGYGQIYIPHKVTGRNSIQGAHRFFWEHLVGPIPDGYELHHWCHNPPCVNPEHLEPLTVQDHHDAHIGMRDTCKAGHAWVESNTYWRSNGTRQCRACKARRQSAAYWADPQGMNAAASEWRRQRKARQRAAAGRE